MSMAASSAMWRLSGVMASSGRQCGGNESLARNDRKLTSHLISKAAIAKAEMKAARRSLHQLAKSDKYS
jgi:hypothetical protein